MATKAAAKAAPKKAMPARGQRTAKHAATTAMPMVDKKWQAEQDVHHLKRAAEVKADPARHKAAVSHAQAEMKALATVTKK